MFEIYLAIAISGVLGVLSGALGTYAMVKRYLNTDKIIEISEELLDEVAINKDIQQKIYIVGAILGQGIKGGIGLGGGKGGKFKIEDIFGILVQKGVEKFFPGAAQGQEQPQRVETFKTPY